MPFFETAAVPGSEPTTWTEYVSVTVALLALVVSIALGLSSRRTARRALNLSEQQEARRRSLLALHLNESVSWQQGSTGERLLGFSVLIANPTDRSTALIAAELHLTYSVASVLTTVKVRHGPESSSVNLPPSVKPIILPVRIEANDAQSGWLLFRVTAQLTRGQPVERYDLVVRDVHGVVETLQTVVFREVSPSDGS